MRAFKNYASSEPDLVLASELRLQADAAAAQRAGEYLPQWVSVEAAPYTVADGLYGYAAPSRATPWFPSPFSYSLPPPSPPHADAQSISGSSPRLHAGMLSAQEEEGMDCHGSASLSPSSRRRAHPAVGE